ITPSLASLARWPAVPQPKSGARPVATEASTLVTYCSSDTTSILIWTPLSLWASLKASIIFCQTSPSEAASQLQWTISVVAAAKIRSGTHVAAPAAAAAPTNCHQFQVVYLSMTSFSPGHVTDLL